MINCRIMEGYSRCTSVLDYVSNEIKGLKLGYSGLQQCGCVYGYQKLRANCYFHFQSRERGRKFVKHRINTFLYNPIQCGRTAEYLLGPNSASSVVMLSRCCYMMDLRDGKK